MRSGEPQSFIISTFPGAPENMDAVFLFGIFQEGTQESNSTSEAALHCAAVHEGHFSRAANDLYSSPYVHPLPHTSVSFDQSVHETCIV